MVKKSHEHYFGVSLLVTMFLKFSREMGFCLVLVTNTKYIDCFSFPNPEPRFSLVCIQDLLIVIAKLVRKECLGTVKHDWTSIVWEWTNRKLFLFARGNIWNSKKVIYNKTKCLLRQICYMFQYKYISCYSGLVLYAETISHTAFW